LKEGGEECGECGEGREEAKAMEAGELGCGRVGQCSMVVVEGIAPPAAQPCGRDAIRDVV
jgi:hypothetical protein